MSGKDLGGITEFVFNLNDPAFYDRKDLHAEERRIFEICHGCRLCAGLCPSFDILFELLDSRDISAEALTDGDLDAVMGPCFYCKLCYTKCPYTPPHEYRLDFPHLALRHKAVVFKEKGAPLAARMLADPQGMARKARPLAPLANAVNRNRLARKAMAPLLRIHPDAPLPPVAFRTFASRFRKLPKPAEVRERVVLFTTCLVDANYPELGEVLVRFLNACSVEVLLPEGLDCCGIPSFDIGDLSTAAARARRNVKALLPYVRQGLAVIAPVSSCAMALSREYPLLVPGEESKEVAGAVQDLFDYLAGLKAKGLWPRGEPRPLGEVAYHLPCHLKQMGAGFKGRDLLKDLPGTTVKVLDACSGHDGTYGIRLETYADSMKVGRKLMGRAREARGTVVTECPLSGLQITHGTGREALHPLLLLARAYGIA
jgi:Fe-S oxidoreductase